MRWYKGINQDFGITTGSYSNPLILYSAIDGGLNGWKYTKDSSYFRIMDFMDYYHNAKNPFSFFTFRLKSRLIEPSTTFSFTFRYVRNDYDSDHEMGFSDVFCHVLPNDNVAASFLYIEFLVFKKSQGIFAFDRKIIPSIDNIGTMSTNGVEYTVSFDVNEDETDYRIIPCMTEVSDVSQTGTHITIPETSFLDFTVKSL